MENMQNKQEELTAGQASVRLFDIWQEFIIDGSLPDCKRYEKEFFEFYGDSVASTQREIDKFPISIRELYEVAAIRTTRRSKMVSFV